MNKKPSENKRDEKLETITPEDLATVGGGETSDPSSSFDVNLERLGQNGPTFSFGEARHT